MARISQFQGASKTVAATTAQTLVWSGSDLESEGVVGYHISFTGAGNIITDVSRVRVKANGIPIWDCNILHYRAWLQRMSYANYAIAAGTDPMRFTLWLNMPDAATDDLRDIVQFPVNTQATVEVQTTAGTVAGTAILGWTKTDVPASFYSKLYSQAINCPASSASFSYPFAEDGFVAGISLNTVGLDRAELWLSGTNILNLPGVAYVNAATGDMFTDYQIVDDGITLVDPIFRKINNGLPAASGNSYLRLTTQAGWVGAANELGVYALVPQGSRR